MSPAAMASTGPRIKNRIALSQAVCRSPRPRGEPISTLQAGPMLQKKLMATPSRLRMML